MASDGQTDRWMERIGWTYRWMDGHGQNYIPLPSVGDINVYLRNQISLCNNSKNSAECNVLPISSLSKKAKKNRAKCEKIYKINTATGKIIHMSHLSEAKINSV